MDRPLTEEGLRQYEEWIEEIKEMPEYKELEKGHTKEVE